MGGGFVAIDHGADVIEDQNSGGAGPLIPLFKKPQS